MPQKQVVVVGAGLAGLACAVRLQELGMQCSLLEKSECVGGRVRTHVVEGYRLDRGFQVLLTAYPSAEQTLDLGALQLKAFHSGAQIRYHGRFHSLGDPSRHPGDAFSTVLSPIGSLSDKTRILQLRNRVTSLSLDELMAKPEVTTRQRLREYGFSEKMVQQFFRPFLGGIFLEPDLVTSSRKFEFVMRMFCQGEAALPQLGMQAIPQQLANRLKSDVLRMSRPVKSLESNGVKLADGSQVSADVIVLATAEGEADRLLGTEKPLKSAAATCLYYSADSSPVRGPWLVLNGETQGPINNLCVPTELHAGYAPPGKALVSVTVLGVSADNADLEKQVRAQLVVWYGTPAANWRHLRTYPIPQALTLQAPPLLQLVRKPVKLSDKLYVCGDYLSITSIEGAIASGIRCAEAIHGG